MAAQSPPPKLRVTYVFDGKTTTRTLDAEAALKVSRLLAQHWGFSGEPHTWVRVRAVTGWGRPAGLFECRGCRARAQLPEGGTLMEDRVYVALAGVSADCPCTDDPPPISPTNPSSRTRPKKCTRG